MRFILPVLLCLPLLAHATPLERTEALVKAFKDVKRPAEGQTLSPADKTHNEAAFKALDGFLHQGEITSRPLAPHVKAFKPEELTKFKTRFWETLRLVAYPSSGAFFEEAKYTLKAGKLEGDKGDVDMHAELASEDLETDLVFHWEKIDGAWWLVDVSFDGASLVIDYQNQFGRIIKKKGVAGLLEALDKKYAQVKGS